MKLAKFLLGLLFLCSANTFGAWSTPSSINVSAIASRTSGVAPLGVHFDATGTTSPVTTICFHECEFRWDFGDSTAGTWTYGTGINTSRNITTGPFVAHVYKTPGTYVTCLQVTDGTNTVPDVAPCSAGKGVPVATTVVSDPAVVYAGTNTICFSTSGTFAGCPTGATQTTTSSFSTAMTSLATGKRLLFRGGETFTSATNQVFFSAAGPWTVGTYPLDLSLGQAKVNSTLVNKYILATAGDRTGTAKDGRIMDIEFTGGTGSMSTSGSGFLSNLNGTSNAYFDQLTLLNLYVHDMGDGVNNAYFSKDALINLGAKFTHDYWVIQDCNFTRFNGGSATHGIYGYFWGLAIMGTKIDHTDGFGSGTSSEHNFRVDFINRLFFNNNTVAFGGATKEDLALRGMPYYPNDVDSAKPSFVGRDHGGTQDYMSRYVVVSDNYLSQDAQQGAIIVAGPNSTSHYRFEDYLLERNFLLSSTASASSTVLEAHAATRVTTRNNIYDMRNTTQNTAMTLSNAGGNTYLRDTNVWASMYLTKLVSDR